MWVKLHHFDTLGIKMGKRKQAVVQSLLFTLSVVFCHLIRDAYFNSVKDIIPFMTDSFKPSNPTNLLFVNLIPSKYLNQKFHHYVDV